MNTFNERNVRRGQPGNKGQFAAKHNGAPAIGLGSPVEERRARERARIEFATRLNPSGTSAGIPSFTDTDDGVIISYAHVDGYSARVTPAGITHTLHGEEYASADDLPRSARAARNRATEIDNTRVEGLAYLEARGTHMSAVRARDDAEASFVGEHAIWNDTEIQREAEASVASPYDKRIITDYLNSQGITEVPGKPFREIARRALFTAGDAAHKQFLGLAERIETDLGGQISWSPIPTHTSVSREASGKIVNAHMTAARSEGAFDFMIGVPGNRKLYKRAADIPDEYAVTREKARKFEEAAPLIMEAYQAKSAADHLERRGELF